MKEDSSPLHLAGSRRDFLHGVGGITLMIGATGIVAACTDEPAQTPDSAALDATMRPNIWLTIGADDVITISYPGTEMGQGSQTALPLILADELDADWRNVRVETLAIHDTRYGNPAFANLLYTAGSATVDAYYDIMRKAGAQARKLLVEAAARRWAVPSAELRTEASAVVHPDSGRRLTYGQIAAFADVPPELPEVDETDFKPRSAHRYLGTDVQRLDTLDKTTGKAEYGIDVQVPGMVYASILRAPVEGERPQEIDGAASRQVAGVTDVVELPYGVAVVGTTVEATQWGKQALKVTWTESSPFRTASTQANLVAAAARAQDLSVAGLPWSDQGDIESAFASAARIAEAVYTTDAAYHAQMEPMNATAKVSPDGKSAEIWVSTQTQSLSILGAAEALETTPDRITLHPTYLGGGYGRRSLFRQTYIDDALFVSRAIQKPVKVIWSREDDVKDGVFRPAAAQYLRAALDQSGRVVGWHHRVGVPLVLEFMNPPRWAASGGRDGIAMYGAESAQYDVPNKRAEHVVVERPSRVCAWRGVATSYTKFAAESFVDEIAYARNMNPLDLRRELCRNDPRSLLVLETVAEMADWGRVRSETALGLALAAYRTSAVAGVAEISVERQTGVIRVLRYWLAADPGYVIAPRNTEAQLEGNVIFGISNALKERITVENGVVQQSNFHDYSVMRLAEMPELHVRALSTDNHPSGVGELGIATVGAAIANALFAATGSRVRHLPLTPDRVLAALGKS